jgi:hypothetical protein
MRVSAARDLTTLPPAAPPDPPRHDGRLSTPAPTPAPVVTPAPETPAPPAAATAPPGPAATSASPPSSLATAPSTPPPPSRKAPRPIRVVVYDITAADLSAKRAQLVSECIVEEVRKLERVSVSSIAEVRAMLSLEEQRQMLGCDQASCLVQLAGALGADDLVLGQVGSVGDSTVLTIKRVDLQTAEVRHEYTRRMQGGGGEELIEAVTPAVETIFPEYAVRGGSKRGVSSELVKRWSPPPLKPWAVWSTGGIGLAGLAVGGYFYYEERKAADEFTQITFDLKRDIKYPTDRVTAAEQEPAIWNGRKRTALIVGGSFVVVSGLLAWLFVDWSPEVVVAASAGGMVVGGSF